MQKGAGGKRGSTREHEALALHVAIPLERWCFLIQLLRSRQARWLRLLHEHKITQNYTKKAVTVRPLYQHFFVEIAGRAQTLLSASLTVLPNSAFSVGVGYSCWHSKRITESITESQNHRTTECLGLEVTSVGHLVQPPC